MNDAASIASILKTSKTIAVVGLSTNRYRASNGVSRYMQSAGYRIIPVNPGVTEVLGEKAYPTLESIPEKVDIVNVFRRPEYVPEIVDSAIRIGARSLWLQEEVIHEEAAGRAEQNGLAVVMDRCLLKEHQRLSHSGEL